MAPCRCGQSPHKKGVIFIKKTLLFVLFGAVLITGAFYFDYLYNRKSYNVDFYMVSDTEIQNIAEFRGILSKNGNLKILTGVIPNYKAENFEMGDYSKVTYGEKNYDGNIYSLTPIYNDLYEVKISVITNEEITGEARAKILGRMIQNIKIVPYSCIFTDETGSDAVMLENMGYAVKRKVKLGKINNETGTEVDTGIFLEEKLIINPNNIKTGDKVN